MILHGIFNGLCVLSYTLSSSSESFDPNTDPVSLTGLLFGSTVVLATEPVATEVLSGFFEGISVVL